MATVLDMQMFPHLLDSIIANASHSVLLSLRATSRDVLERVDKFLALHLVVRKVNPLSRSAPKVSAISGRIPLLCPVSSDEIDAERQTPEEEEPEPSQYQQWFSTAAPGPTPHDPLLSVLRHTRVLDILDDLHPPELYNIVHALPPGALHTLRFRPGDRNTSCAHSFPNDFHLPPQTTTVQFIYLHPRPNWGLYGVSVSQAPIGTRRFVINASYSPSHPRLQDAAIGISIIAETVEEVVIILRPRANNQVDGKQIPQAREREYARPPQSPSALKLYVQYVLCHPEILKRTMFTFVGVEDLPLRCFGVDEAEYNGGETLSLQTIRSLVVQAVRAELQLERNNNDRGYGVQDWSDQDMEDALEHIRFLSLAEYKASISEEQADLELKV